MKFQDFENTYYYKELLVTYIISTLIIYEIDNLLYDYIFYTFSRLRILKKWINRETVKKMKMSLKYPNLSKMMSFEDNFSLR